MFGMITPPMNKASTVMTATFSLMQTYRILSQTDPSTKTHSSTISLSRHPVLSGGTTGSKGYLDASGWHHQ
jgi:hypothetical protein